MCRLLTILVVTAVGCGSTEPAQSSPDVTRPPAADDGSNLAGTTAPTASSPPVASATASATASPSPTVTAAPAQEIDPAFPPLEDACKVDSDCAPTEFAVGPRVLCCSGCGGVAGTRAWVAKAAAVCKQREAAKKVGPCPPWDCAQPVARCEAGSCTQR